MSFINKINATAGKRLYFDNLSATTTTNINRFTWGLYAPDSSYVSNTDNYIYNDFQYDFTNSGEYTLVIRGQAVTDKLDYKFRVIQTDISNTRDIITPGVGKSNDQLDILTATNAMNERINGMASVFSELRQKSTAMSAFGNSILAYDPTKPGVDQIEKDIWIMWMGTLR